MLHLMLDDDSRFLIDASEVNRSGLSFTVDTLSSYAERYPDAERFFLVGADAFGTLESWREPARIVRLAHLAILVRQERAPAGAAGGGERSWLSEEEVQRRVQELGGAEAKPPVVLATRRVDVSSTEIRARVRMGKPVRGFVTDAVARYIDRTGLYR